MLRFAWIATNLLGLAIILSAIFHKTGYSTFLIGAMLMTVSNLIKFRVFNKGSHSAKPQ
jgi:hypothetical protein